MDEDLLREKEQGDVLIHGDIGEVDEAIWCVAGTAHITLWSKVMVLCTPQLLCNITQVGPVLLFLCALPPL